MARVKPLMEVLRGVTRFGRLTVISEAPRILSPSGFAALAAHVRCDCGTVKVARACSLKNGFTQSCGCLQRELAAIEAAARMRTHGNASKKRPTTEYTIWQGMQSRCYNPKNDNYARYGGRGIIVCGRWRHDFSAFLADMGRRPEGCSIDRQNNDGDYEPDNCVWATAVEQNNNRSSNNRLTIDGVEKTVTEWAHQSGVARHTIYKRLKRDLSPRDAVFGKLRRERKAPHA